MTRRPTISTEENRIAIATMCVVCIAGTTQDDFASATLSVVFTSQFANECKNSLLSGAYHVGRSLRLPGRAGTALSCRRLILAWITAWLAPGTYSLPRPETCSRP